MSDDTDDLRVLVARGLSALKVMMEGLTGRVERIERSQDALRERIYAKEAEIAVLKERLENTKQHTDRITGKFEALKDGEKSDKMLKAEKRKLAVERWKGTAPIIVALISSLAALVVALIQALIGLFSSSAPPTP
jgi:predicted nuclease with TOPRIM domain